ncbi:MAG: putative transrane anti-sigma factor [Frankiales bacterium]|nr:putative transrane anti-sigma factor [Frankiales bacterium]
MNAHDKYDELAVGHALNALEPAEESEFLAHLPGCAACARVIGEHQETLGHLSYAVESVEPPAALLEGIRSGVAESGRAGAFPAPVSLAERRRSRTVKLTTALVGVAASVVLVAALLLANLSLSSRNSDLRQQDAAFQRTVNGLLIPGAQRVELKGDGTAVAVVHNGSVDLVLSGVKKTDAHSVYVLWQQDTSGAVRAAGTFDVASDGLTVVNKGLHVGNGITTLMVSREQGKVAPSKPLGGVVFSGSTA